VLFSHLTSSVVAVDTYIMKNRIEFRESVKDLGVFKLIAGTGKGSAPKSQSTGQRVKTNLSTAHGLLGDLNSSPDAFKDLYNKVLQAMGNDCDERLRRSSTLALRLVSSSALRWNLDSQNKPRDWVLLAIVFALEATYVPSYRPKLLRECPGVHALRSDLHTLFFSIARTIALPTSGSSEVSYATTWEFPDGIPLAEDRTESSLGSFTTLLANWRAARNLLPGGGMDPAFDLICVLEKNKFLQSSVPGSVDALAHYHISQLAEVHLFPFTILPFFFDTLLRLCIRTRLASITSPKSNVGAAFSPRTMTGLWVSTRLSICQRSPSPTTHADRMLTPVIGPLRYSPSLSFSASSSPLTSLSAWL